MVGLDNFNFALISAFKNLAKGRFFDKAGISLEGTLFLYFHVVGRGLHAPMRGLLRESLTLATILLCILFFFFSTSHLNFLFALCKVFFKRQ